MATNGNNNNGDEPNVEGLVGEFLSRMPWNDTTACNDIITLFEAETKRFLANREARHEAEDRELEKGEDD